MARGATRDEGDACEVVTIDSAVEGARLWLVTTNDNLRALRFYQRRGFALVAVHPNALARSRELKPEIPEVGMHGIPLRDEVEPEMWLDER